MKLINKPNKIDLVIAALGDFRKYISTKLPLSPEERKRGKSIISYKKQEEYLITHSLLRIILGIYLNTPATTIPLRRTKKGKPYVEENFFSHTSPVFFSISHSMETILFSFSFDGRTGVDIEKRRPVRNMQDLVSYVFPAEEQDIWKFLSPKKREDFFFRTWTRREAALKCIGLSAAEDINSFLIREAPETAGEENECSWNTMCKETLLRGRDIHLDLPCYCALSWEGEVRKISLFRAIPGPDTTDQLHIKLLREIVQE